MAITTTANITNLQEKVIGPARMTLKDDVLALKSSFLIERGEAGMDDTFNSPKFPGLVADPLTEGVDMHTQTIVDSNTAISATEAGASVELTSKMLRTVKRDSFLRMAGEAMGSGINVYQEQQFATLVDGFGTAVGLDGASATLGQLGAGLTQLRANSEPVTDAMMRDVSSVVSPAMWHDLAQQLFPSGSGEAHSPNVAQNNEANRAVLSNYWTRIQPFGVLMKVSNNLVTSGNNVRGGIFHRRSAMIYEFMPVHLEPVEYDSSLRALELDMVIDFGQGELLDGHGREWDSDNSSPTS